MSSEDLQNGGGTGGAGDAAQQLADAQAELGKLKGQLSELEGAKENLERQLGDANKELLGEDYLNYLENKGKTPPQASGSEEGSGLEIGQDFDRASNTEVAKFLVGHMDGKLKGAMEKLGKNQKALDDKIGLAFARLDVAMTASKYDGSDGGPSWAENEKEIFKIAKANPSWGAEQCYKQFKLENSARLKEKEDADRRKAEEEEELITEKGGVPGSTVQDKDMDKEDAAKLAYRKAFGNKKQR